MIIYDCLLAAEQQWSAPPVVAPIASTARVDDGQWHQVVLTGAGTTQTMVLDGAVVNTLSGVIDHAGTKHAWIGAGWSGGYGPSQPARGWRFFNGSVAEVALFDKPLSSPDITAMRQAGVASAKLLDSVRRPSGILAADVDYNSVTGSVSQVTDANGGVWQLPAPEVTGSWRVHASTVLGASPTNYWRFAENGASLAVNQVSGGVATYNAVTLGQTGGPFDDPAVTTDDTTVAKFNGSTSLVKLPSSVIPTPSTTSSVSMWFKLDPGQYGVLYGYQANELPNASPGYVPALYVGPDGRLRGSYWPGGGGWPITTAGAVNNGQWHHVTLTVTPTKQRLYLDGSRIEEINATIGNFGAAHAQIGAGQWNGWAGSSGTTFGYWPGEIAEVSFYPTQLTDAQVSAQFNARAKSTGAPVKTVSVVDPGNHTSKYVYDANTGRKVADIDPLGHATQFGYDTGGFVHTVTDANGNVTTTTQDVRGNTISSKTCQRFATNCSTVFYTYYPNSTDKILTTPDARNDVVLTMRDGRSANETDNTYRTTYRYDIAGNRTEVDGSARADHEDRVYDRHDAGLRWWARPRPASRPR